MRKRFPPSSAGWRYILSIVLLLNCSSNIHSQDYSNYEAQNSSDFIKDTLIIPNKDSTSFDTVHFSYPKEEKIKSDIFYDSLKAAAYRNRLTKTAHKLLFQDPIVKLEHEENNTEDYFKEFEGKKIRKIHITKLNPFGPTIYDTLLIPKNWPERFANQVHIKTLTPILKNNLLFETGDKVDPYLFYDNERLIRNLDYIKDTRIILSPIQTDSTMVDVTVIVKDLWSIGANLNMHDVYSGEFQLFDNNIFGLGQKLQGNLFYETEQSFDYGYEFKYNISNIGNSFIKSSIRYLNYQQTETFNLKLERKFFAYNTKYAGGIEYQNQSTVKDIRKTDTIYRDEKISYFEQDVWFGRAFLLQGESDRQKRTKLFAGVRFFRQHYFNQPLVLKEFNYEFHDKILILGSLAYSRQHFYRTRLVYEFGRTEDFPTGALVQINGGYEKAQFFERTYLGAKLAHGIYLNKIGYVQGSIETGGFIRNKNFEQGILNVKTRIISNLHHFQRNKLRHFLGINYSYGINRFRDEYLTFNKEIDIRGLSNNSFNGLQKLSLNSETLLFTNLFIYDFRFAFFFMADLGMIGPTSSNIFENDTYSGLGAGIRVRNENFVFSTFQLKLAYYPLIPEDDPILFLRITGEDKPNQEDYAPLEPGIFDFN